MQRATTTKERPGNGAAGRPVPRARAAGRGRMLTSEEFLDWPEEDIHADLIGGEVFTLSPLNLMHGRMANLARATKAARRPR